MADIEHRTEAGSRVARGRGRPPIPEERARSQRVVTFVTRAELEALKTLADESDSTLSGAVYRLLRQGLETKQGEI